MTSSTLGGELIDVAIVILFFFLYPFFLKTCLFVLFQFAVQVSGFIKGADGVSDLSICYAR